MSGSISSVTRVMYQSSVCSNSVASMKDCIPNSMLARTSCNGNPHFRYVHCVRIPSHVKFYYPMLGCSSCSLQRKPLQFVQTSHERCLFHVGQSRHRHRQALHSASKSHLKDNVHIQRLEVTLCCYTNPVTSTAYT